MKRIITLAAALLVVAGAFAQDNAPKKKHSNREVEKIGYITNKLQLTPEEAQVFWPVYNQYSNEAKDARKAVRSARKALRPKKDEPALTDNEIKARIDAFIKATEAETALLSKYNSKFLKVLPAAKVAKLYIAEESFRNKLLKEMNSRGPKGSKGPKGGKIAKDACPAPEAR